MRRVFQPPSDALTAARLLDREEILIEQARHVSSVTPGRKHQIEEELAEIHRLLEALGFRHSVAPSRAREDLSGRRRS